MGLFSLHEPDGHRGPGVSIIGSDLLVEGELSSDGMVRIAGEVVGNVRAQLQVVVAKGGRVNGDIHTREVIIGGETRGSVFADERVEVQASASIHGNIRTRRMVVYEGAQLTGHIRIGTPQPSSWERSEAKTEAIGSVIALRDRSKRAAPVRTRR